MNIFILCVSVFDSYNKQGGNIYFVKAEMIYKQDVMPMEAN